MFVESKIVVENDFINPLDSTSFALLALRYLILSFFKRWSPCATKVSHQLERKIYRRYI